MGHIWRLGDLLSTELLCMSRIIDYDSAGCTYPQSQCGSLWFPPEPIWCSLSIVMVSMQAFSSMRALPTQPAMMIVW